MDELPWVDLSILHNFFQDDGAYFSPLHVSSACDFGEAFYKLHDGQFVKFLGLV